MPYRGDDLEDLVMPLRRGVRRFAENAAVRVGDRLHERVVDLTPVAKLGAEGASYASMGEWIQARGGRVPGTLKSSWRVGSVRITGGGGRVFSVDVYTMDRIAPFVEFKTAPHLIYARPGKVLAIPTAQGMRFATMVRHPGTQGAYMMTTAMAEIAQEWVGVAEQEWRQEVNAGRFWRA